MIQAPGASGVIRTLALKIKGLESYHCAASTAHKIVLTLCETFVFCKIS
jgi:hypothetical protein